ncbi:hypothetical protein [Salinibacterium sp. ZJ77]|uniref:hypothetical protein n=1 Tax=Salinibacterium sp. ZJ77 TaxID=2708337 RepID=UPI0014244B5D|nr:hypothetical protein [Salinibacterium sp. ZJ77]
MLVTVAFAALATLYAQFASWAFALASALVTLMALLAVVLRVTPAWAVDLNVALGLGLVALAAASAALVLVRRNPARRAAPFATVRNGLILAIPAGVSLAMMSLAARPRGAGPRWAMHNDAVWNMVSARLIISDGGVDPELRPHSSPLTAGMMAVVMAPGRGGLAGSSLLEHDVWRVAELWAILIGAAMLCSALVGWDMLRGRPSHARLAVAAVCSFVPATWFVAGFAIFFGHLNAIVGLVLLLASWIAWREGERAPRRAALALSTAAVALLAVWAPLGLLAAVLAFVLLMRCRPRSPVRMRPLLNWAFAAVPIPLYGMLVTVQDFIREGTALAVDGGIHDPGVVATTVVAMLAVTSAIVHARRTERTHVALGIALVVTAAAIVVLFLVWQRARGGEPVWGYYPIKMAWITVAFLWVIAVATLSAAVSGAAWKRAGLAAVSAACAIGTLLVVAAPPTWTWRGPLAFPMAEIAAGVGVAARGEDALNLFSLASADRVMAVRWGSTETDQFVNQWLLQLASDHSTDPIRAFSYDLDVNDDAHVCDALRAWGDHVIIHTRDHELSTRLRGACEGADFEVRLG